MGVDSFMINEVVDYLRQEIKALNDVSFVANDYIPISAKDNSIAIRLISSNDTFRPLNDVKEGYDDITFNILYKGTKQRDVSMAIIEKISKSLDSRFNIVFQSTNIISMLAERPTYAFIDDNDIIHYNFNIDIKYN